METPDGPPPPSPEPGEGGDDALDATSEDAVAPVKRSVRTARRRRRNLLIALVALVAVVAAVVAAVLLSGEDPPPNTTTTTTSSTTTSTTIAALPGGTVEIATAKESVTTLSVRADAPDGWDTMPVALVMDPAPPRPPVSQALVGAREPFPAPGDPIVGRTAVDGGWEFANPGPYVPHQPFTMVVTERRGDWAKVQLPVRPNGTEGWVAVTDVDLSTTSYRIEINVAERMLRAYDDTEMFLETPVVVGTPWTQTPTGAFFVTDIVPQTSPSFGPVALATNAYSEMTDEFDGGVPVIAIHGTDRPDRLGQDTSNGCVRLPNDAIQQLADTVPLGTPIYIWP